MDGSNRAGDAFAVCFALSSHSLSLTGRIIILVSRDQQLSNLGSLAAIASNVLLHDMSLYFGPANATALGSPQPRTRAQLQQVCSRKCVLFPLLTHFEQWLHAIASAAPPQQMIIGLGLQEQPGFSNASCAGGVSRPHALTSPDSLLFQGGCSDESKPDCDCYNYGWTRDDIDWILQELAVVGVARLRIWRQVLLRALTLKP